MPAVWTQDLVENGYIDLFSLEIEIITDLCEVKINRTNGQMRCGVHFRIQDPDGQDNESCQRCSVQDDTQTYVISHHVHN